MNEIIRFDRCIYCFAPLEEDREADGKGSAHAPCRKCGYEDGLCSPRIHWLSCGTILKGRYMTGKLLEEREEELVYLGWDLAREKRVEVHEYYPAEWLQRDITLSEQVNCRAGAEEALEKGRQAFFEKAKLYYQCRNRVEPQWMDFFVRNQTCYFVREREGG